MLIDIGARWSSTLVLAEAELALHRWAEDVEVLRPFGWGPLRRERFEALVDQLRMRHDAWQAPRTSAPPPRDGEPVAGPGERARARSWLDRAISILEAAELESDEATSALGSIPPPGDGTSTLLASVETALARCKALRQVLDPDAATGVFFLEGEAAIEALDKALDVAPVDPRDRADELDTLDGRVYLSIRGLNRAARRAFASAGEPEKAARYVFQFLLQIGKGTDE
ncbi:MAG: hypothetical protein HY909_29590 [Deltaproteobacteria bacterium]|nr:hypothetical protein [Deltaproteobacteria bacterium]